MCWSLEDLTLYWKSFQRQEPLLGPRVLQGWETKGRWWKVSLIPWIHMYDMEEPASCASWRGKYPPPPHISTQHFSECTALSLWESVFILVLVFWYRSRMLEKPGHVLTNHHLHHHSVCLSQCSPYGLTTHCRCIESFLEPNVGHIWKTINLVPDSHEGNKKFKYRL